MSLMMVMASRRRALSVSLRSIHVAVPNVSTMDMVVPRNVISNSLSHPFTVRSRPNLGILNFAFIPI